MLEQTQTTQIKIDDFDAWYENLKTLPYSQQVQQAMNVYNSQQSSQVVKEMALYILATRPGVTNLFAQQALANMYSSSDFNTRVRMETMLLEEVKAMPSSVLQEIAQATLSTQETIYPWIVFAWEGANASLLLDNAGTIERLGHPQYYANPAIFGLEQNFVQTLGAGLDNLIINPKPNFESVCVTMVLPTTGSYAKISNNIIRGAKAAQSELAKNNVHILLNILDTEDPLWVERVKLLPAHCSIVGGPLRAASLDKALEANLLDTKAFFSFMPQLPIKQIAIENQNPIQAALTEIATNEVIDENVEEIELPNAYIEGENIWRFFTSPNDQFEVILQFAENELKIKEFASFHPNDAYGTRMSTRFLEMAIEHDIYVNQISYLYDSPQSWSRYAGDFLGSVTPKGGGLPEIKSDVQGFFFTDTWSNMEVLAPVMHYQGAVYLPFFGTALWENELISKKNQSLEYYDLTIFPGSWNKNSYSYGAIQLKNTFEKQKVEVDDWATIGYDFVQMVSALGYKEPAVDAKILNEKLFSLQRLAWAGAPFVWNEEGEASRKLFLFQPATDGMKILDKDEFFANYQLRLENVNTLQEFYEREKERRLNEEREDFFEDEQERMIIFEEEQRIREFELEKQRLLEQEESSRIN